MSLTRRHFNQSLMALLGASLLPSVAPAAELVEGLDWRALTPPQPPADPARIEVLEFFSYGCPHCSNFNPILKPWAAALPPDVAFRRVPVSFGRAAWAHLSRLYYALEYSGDLERLDQEVFDALTQGRARLFSEESILEWVGSRGVDTKSFAELLRSFAVETQFTRGETLAQRYGINAVPTLIVGGRYVVLSRPGSDFRDWLRIADTLIEQERGTRATG